MTNSAIITGASSGLGRELAILFSARSHIILSGRDQAGLEETRALCKYPLNPALIAGDLRDTQLVSRLADFDTTGSLRYLVCCAGVYHHGNLMDHSIWDIEDILQSNLLSTVKLIRMVYPHLLPGSSIIHINSIAGKSVDSKELIYSASKHGMRAFLQGLRFEARQRGIRVLDVFPGAIQTPMNAGNAAYAKMMDAKEVACAIYQEVIAAPKTLQIEELHLGRFLV